MNRLSTPVPRRLAYRPKDARGYPVPYIVASDAMGRPQFVVNDHVRVHDVLQRRACGICGRSLDRDPVNNELHCWFVGGPRCFYHPRGAFLDPPMHRDCAEYALKVCPYLAVRHYNGNLGDVIIDRQAKGERLRPDMLVVKTEGAPDSNPDRPDLFVLARASGYKVTGFPNAVILPTKDWQDAMVWRHGAVLDPSEYVFDDNEHTIRLRDKESV